MENKFNTFILIWQDFLFNLGLPGPGLTLIGLINILDQISVLVGNFVKMNKNTGPNKYTGLRIFKQKMTLLDASLRHGFRPDQQPSHSMLCNQRTKLSNDLEIVHFPELSAAVFGSNYMYSKDLDKHTEPNKLTGGKFYQNE